MGRLQGSVGVCCMFFVSESCSAFQRGLCILLWIYTEEQILPKKEIGRWDTEAFKHTADRQTDRQAGRQAGGYAGRQAFRQIWELPNIGDPNIVP